MKFPMACLALVLGMLLPPAAWSQVSVSINVAPPPLLLYAKPPVPGEGYIWMPGIKRSNRVSFSDGREGMRARPTASQRQFQSAEHAGPRAEQVEHEAAARGRPEQRGRSAHQEPPQQDGQPRKERKER